MVDNKDVLANYNKSIVLFGFLFFLIATTYAFCVYFLRANFISTEDGTITFKLMPFAFFIGLFLTIQYSGLLIRAYILREPYVSAKGNQLFIGGFFMRNIYISEKTPIFIEKNLFNIRGPRLIYIISDRQKLTINIILCEEDENSIVSHIEKYMRKTASASPKP